MNKRAWTYTDDLGRDWRRAASGDIVTQVNGGAAVIVGGATAAGTVLKMPSWIKPRVALVSSATGARARVVAYENGAPILTVGATIELEVDGADVSFTTYGSEGERSRNGITQAT
jgi:ribose 5-phosphate isomerase